MTRTMFDATHALVPNIPPTAQLVAGYLAPSPFAWTATDWARFPNAVHVRIAVRASTNDGQVLDVERGDVTPAQAPGWVVMRRAAGCDPTVYCSSSTWAAVQREFATQGVAQPRYWVASYPGGGPVIPSGAVAHQYESTSKYDRSAVADFWPGVDTPGGDMELTDSIGKNTSGATVTVLQAFDTMYSSLVDSKAAPSGRTLYDVLGALQAQVSALSGALSTEEAAIIASVAGADADVKAGVAQLLSAIAAGGVDPKTFAATLAPLLAPLLPPGVTAAQIASEIETELAAALTAASTGSAS